MKLIERQVTMLETLVQEKIEFVEDQMEESESLDYASCEMTFVLLKIAELRIVMEELAEELNKTKKFIKGQVKLK